MRILISVVNKNDFLYILDTESGQVQNILIRSEFVDNSVKLRPTVRPFGLSWDSQYLYVANNCKIHRFDKQFRYVDTPVTSLPANTHQISVKNDLLFLASPWSNSIIRMRLDTFECDYFNVGRSSWWLPAATGRKYDRLHINSLLITEDKCYVNLHCYAQSSVVVYSFPSFDKIDCFPNGVCSHNLGLDQHLYSLSTGEKLLINNSGTKFCPLEGNHFFRGFGMTTEYFVVGVSNWNKVDRYTPSQVLLINRKTNETKSFPISGDISDLRILDEFDFAHQVSIY